MSSAHEVGGGTPYTNIIVKKKGIDGYAQVVSTKLTDDLSLTVPGLGVHDGESLAAYLGWKAEYKMADAYGITGAGIKAYEEAKEQLDRNDQRARMYDILNPKPVRPVGFFGLEDDEEVFVFDNDKAGIDRPGSTIYRLQKTSFF
jgi:hypothetical protein